MAETFDRLLIPASVHHEVTIAGRGRPGAVEVARANWIKQAEVDISLHPRIAVQCDGLGRGEADAIVLAASLPADLLIVDERKARRVARTLDLAVVGSVGLLEAGFRRGNVEDLRGAYIALLRQGIRLDLKMIRDSLARFGLPPL
jgi:predicted nucleic acid-binding protein